MSSKKKRVTVKYVSPNPLFEEWLTKWRDEAVEKSSKMQYCFGTALQSLKRYPLPLESGKECKILKGFGDKLCLMLDEKLKKHKETEKNDRNSKEDITSSDNENEDSNNTSKNKKRKCVTRRADKSSETYVPQHGSGGYAILVTLLIKSQEACYKGYLGKTEIIEHARALSNKSFTKPDLGSFYTAWSSMQTLISKGLVLKWSNPAKFKLTDQGLALAISLKEKSDFHEHSSEKGIDDGSSKNQYISDSIPDEDIIMIDNYEPMNVDYSASNHKENDNMMDTSSQDISKYSSRDSSVEEINAQHTLINKYSLDKNPNKVKGSVRLPKISELDEEFMKNAAKYSKDNLNSKKLDVADEYNTPGPSKININTDSYVHFTSKESTNQSNELISKQSIINSGVGEKTDIAKKTNAKTSKPKLGKFLSETGSSNTLKTSLKSYKSDNISDSSNGATEAECFLMGPNSFDVILLVDNQENSDSKNGEIQDGLKSSSVKFETRDLKIGDYTWICRCRHTNRELVLPYLVERKRMDDFGGSIKDGRYHEQKFRLKRSGIENLTYLVESHGKNSSVGLPLTSLYQAATNTALQDNFFIKFTNNIKETSNYLASFSKGLVKLYKDKTLVSCSRDDITPVDLNDDLISLMEFKQFNKSSTKNQKMKVSDMFVKVLIQTKGMSVDKAMAIVERYPTLRHLYRAYENSPQNNREKLLSDIKYGKMGRTIGLVLSKTIFQLFTFERY